MGLDTEPMLDRLRRRQAIVNEQFAGCRRVETCVDGVEWTIGHTDERVLLALGDSEPVELTADEASALAEALALRAAKLA
jgi:hypothetical protein